MLCIITRNRLLFQIVYYFLRLFCFFSSFHSLCSRVRHGAHTKEGPSTRSCGKSTRAKALSPPRRAAAQHTQREDEEMRWKKSFGSDSDTGRSLSSYIYSIIFLQFFSFLHIAHIFFVRDRLDGRLSRSPLISTIWKLFFFENCWWLKKHRNTTARSSLCRECLKNLQLFCLLFFRKLNDKFLDFILRILTHFTRTIPNVRTGLLLLKSLIAFLV